MITCYHAAHVLYQEPTNTVESDHYSHLHRMREAVEPLHRRPEFVHLPRIRQVTRMQNHISGRDRERVRMCVANAYEAGPLTGLPVGRGGGNRWDVGGVVFEVNPSRGQHEAVWRIRD